MRNLVVFVLIHGLVGSIGCGDSEGEAMPNEAPVCERVVSGYGPSGSVDFDVEVIASGLEVPWGIAWLPGGDMLVTERGGTLVRVSMSDGAVTPVADVPITPAGEGGLLGIALHPDFEQNRWFYLYYTVLESGVTTNQVERWILSEDGTSAVADRVVVAAIPARLFHNGGRLRFGPDGYLYVGTGDAGVPELSQDVDNLAGKILRVTDEGEVPDGNPFGNSPTWVYGVRNTQGFDWLDDGRMVMTDHGPTGLPEEDGREGHDELNVVSPGDNLGWPTIFACETDDVLLSPWITWVEPLPPGGTAIYTGSEIPEWVGDVFIGVLGTDPDIPHLHRIRLDVDGIALSETYLRGDAGRGRLREVVMGPDGGLYVTTSNCDGRGECAEGDQILRIGRR